MRPCFIAVIFWVYAYPKNSIGKDALICALSVKLSLNSNLQIKKQ
jgi:hypothetical protein